MQYLENEILRVAISEQGAELHSIIDKRTGEEIVWQADPAVWKRHAPVLFPFVGRLKDQSYTVGGTSYTITQHGFARDLPFAVVESSPLSVTLELTDQEYTHKMYPYAFSFRIRYTLDGATLRKEHITESHSNQTMYYEVGGHDAYRVCLTPEEHIGDYYVAFEQLDHLESICMDEKALLTHEHRALPLDEAGRLFLDPSVDLNGTIILEDLPVRRAVLGKTGSTRRIEMDFSDFPYFALWGAPGEGDTPYVCLEPWSTLPDCAYLDHALENKVGVRALAPNASETLAFSITIHA